MPNVVDCRVDLGSMAAKERRETQAVDLGMLIL